MSDDNITGFIARSHAINFILNSDGRIFSVKFRKRSDNSIREMTARLGVKKHLKGGSLSYDPKKHNLLPVYDMGVKDYRAIPLDGIVSVMIDGRWLDVEEEC